MVCTNPLDNPFDHCVCALHWLAQKKFIIMQGIVRRKKSCAATGCIFVCSMIHGLCRGEKMGGCVWLHISNTFFHHHHHQQPLARFVNHCAVKLFVKSNLIPFYVCLIWGLSTLAVLYNLEQKSSFLTKIQNRINKKSEKEILLLPTFLWLVKILGW